MGRARGQSAGNGAFAGADLDDGAPGDVAQRGDDALDGLRIVKEVLTELWLGGHVSVMVVEAGLSWAVKGSGRVQLLIRPERPGSCSPAQTAESAVWMGHTWSHSLGPYQ